MRPHSRDLQADPSPRPQIAAGCSKVQRRWRSLDEVKLKLKLFKGCKNVGNDLHAVTSGSYQRRPPPPHTSFRCFITLQVIKSQRCLMALTTSISSFFFLKTSFIHAVKRRNPSSRPERRRERTEEKEKKKIKQYSLK